MYNSAKLCKSDVYMECNMNKWDFEEEEVVGVFRKGNFELTEKS